MKCKTSIVSIAIVLLSQYYMVGSMLFMTFQIQFQTSFFCDIIFMKKSLFVNSSMTSQCETTDYYIKVKVVGGMQDIESRQGVAMGMDIFIVTILSFFSLFVI